MNKFSSFCHKMFTKFCEQGVSNRAVFIKNITVIGFALGSIAQTTALIFNDQIPTKEKKFLVPQEILDGVINATLFWFITSKAVNIGKLLALKNKVVPKSLSNLMKNYKPNGKTLVELKENFMQHLTKVGTKEQIKLGDDFVEGMGVATGIFGAILTNNIITPLLRNKLAGRFQQKEIQKEPNTTLLNPYYANFNLKKYNFDKATTLTNPQIKYNTSIKI